jgi:hypothetical protein
MNRIVGGKLSNEYRVVVAAMAGCLCLALWGGCFVFSSSFPVTVCLFHSLTGHSCLTCGMTRSLIAIAHGRLGASLRYHLFGPAVFVGMIGSLLGLGAEAVIGKKILPRIDRKLWRPVFATVAVAWLIYWLIRLLTEQ